MRRVFLMVALLALLTAACKIETNAVIDINADKTGVISVEMGFDEEFQEFAAGFSDEPITEENVFEGNELGSIPGAETATETRGDMTFYIISVPVDDVTNIENELGADENQLAQDVEIIFTDELVTVTATASGEGALADSGGDAGVIPTDQLEESFAANLRLTMPGEILEHNADSVDGNTLTWAVPLTGGTIDVMAQSDPTGSEGGGGFPVWIIIVIAVVALAAVGYFLWNRSKGGAASVPAPEAAPEAPSMDDTPAPPPAE